MRTYPIEALAFSYSRAGRLPLTAVGVAALIESMGITAPGAVAARLMATADGLPCPDVSIYAFFPSVSNGAPQTCTGTASYNSFSGHGQIHALTAVGRAEGAGPWAGSFRSESGWRVQCHSARHLVRYRA